MPIPLAMKAKLRSLDCVVKGLAEHPSREDEILSALDTIAQHAAVNSFEDASASLCSATDGICNGIKIFVSYKIGFGSTAKALIQPFRLFGNGRILFDEANGWPFLCEYADLSGKPYKDVVNSALEQAHWFFLLLPDTALDRSWTMFEAGFFRRSMSVGERLICVHHKDVKPAGPLEDFSRVIATQSSVQQLYGDLLCRKGAIPGMRAIHDQLVAKDLRPLVNAFIQKIEPAIEIKNRFYPRYMDISLGEKNAIKNRGDLLSCKIIAGLGLEDLFGSTLVSDSVVQTLGSVAADLSQPPPSLRELLGGASNSRKYDDLVDVIALTLRKILANEKPETIDLVFRGADYNLYVPELQYVQRRRSDDKLLAAHFTFHEKLSGPIPAAPRELEALSAALRLGYRFRWEVLETFRGISDRAEVTRVRCVVERMERESRQRGLQRSKVNGSEDIRNNPLVQAFSDKHKDIIVAIYKEWAKYRNENNDGILDRAFKNDDPDEIARCFEAIKRLNTDFMRLASQRYSELVRQYWLIPDSDLSNDGVQTPQRRRSG